jgi:hypothetical protein
MIGVSFNGLIAEAAQVRDAARSPGSVPIFLQIDERKADNFLVAAALPQVLFCSAAIHGNLSIRGQ